MGVSRIATARQAVLLAAAVVSAGAAGLVWDAGVAGATAPEQSGWWSQSASTPLGTALPPSPNAPKDGLFVQNAPTGATAVSAVRYAVDTPGDLVLKLGATAGTPVLAACPASREWKAAQNGAMAEAPTCAAGAPEVAGRIADGTVTFTLTDAFVVNGRVDVVVVPRGLAPFETAFATPGEESFAAAPSAAPSPSTAPAAQSAPAPQSAPAGASNSASPSATFPSSAFASPSPDLPAPVVPQLSGTDDTAAAPPVASGSGVNQRRTAPSGGTRTERIPAVMLLLALAAGLVWAAGRQARSPRLLGSLGSSQPAHAPVVVRSTAPRMGGIGRFARPRTADPVRVA